MTRNSNFKCHINHSPSYSLTGPAMATATWTHVAVTLNGDTATMYVNGTPVGTATAPNVEPLFGQPYCYLGRSMWNGDPYFSGRIDDFRIYNHALSGSDVYALLGVGGANVAPLFTSDPLTKPNATEDAAYTAQTLAGSATEANGGTLAFSKISVPAWLAVAANGALTGTPTNANVGENLFVIRVTNASGATDDANLYITVGNVNDAISALHGTATGSPAYAAGRLAQGIMLDGVDDVVTLPDGVAGYHDITIATFVWWNGGGTNQRIFDFGNDTTQYLFLAPNGGSGLRFAIKNGGTEQALTGTAALPINTWQHVAVTLGASGAIAYTPAQFTPALNYIGDSVNTTEPGFSGKVDDFRIYSRVLSAAEITTFQTPLTAPQNLTATPGPQRIALAWNTVPTATSYIVKSATTGGGPYIAVATVGSTSFTHAGLPQIPRYYIITAQNFTGPGPDSAEANATPESPDFTATELRGGTFTFTNNGTAMSMTMPATITGHTYQLQFTTDLIAGMWNDIGTAQTGTGTALNFSIPFAPGTQGYFRFILSR